MESIIESTRESNVNPVIGGVYKYFSGFSSAR